jgi:hypothetical protein
MVERRGVPLVEGDRGRVSAARRGPRERRIRRQQQPRCCFWPCIAAHDLLLISNSRTARAGQTKSCRSSIVTVKLRGGGAAWKGFRRAPPTVDWYFPCRAADRPRRAARAAFSPQPRRPALPRCLRDAAAQGHRQCRRRWRRRRSSHHLDDGRESGDRGDDAGRRKAAAGRVRVDDGQPPMRAGRSARSWPPEKAPLEEESRVPRRAPRRGWCLLA